MSDPASRTTARRVRRAVPASGRGFSVLEMLLVMAFLITIATISYSAVAQQVPRWALRGAATELSTFLQKARLEAIRSGRPVQIEVETLATGDQMVVAYRMKAGVTDLVYFDVDTDGNPVPRARMYLGNPASSYKPALVGAFDTTSGADDNISFKNDKAIYLATGMIDSLGAYRISTGVDDSRNTLEVAVTSLGGQPVLRKYIKVDDRPMTAKTQQFFAETHLGTEWKWKWY